MTTNDQQEAAQELGVQRWVQFSYLVGGLVLFWLLRNVIHSVWDQFAEPQTATVQAAAVIGAVVAAFALYKNPATNKFTTDVAVELARVVWPTRPETWSQTVVVVIFSVLAALILGVMDQGVGWVTDSLIYGRDVFGGGQ